MGKDFNRMQQQHEAISASWNTNAEAAHFFQMVSDGRLSFEQAERDLLMRPEQLARLCKGCPREARIFKAIFKRRCQTYGDFLFLCAHPEQVEEFRQAVYLTGSVSDA